MLIESICLMLTLSEHLVWEEHILRNPYVYGMNQWVHLLLWMNMTGGCAITWGNRNNNQLCRMVDCKVPQDICWSTLASYPPSFDSRGWTRLWHIFCRCFRPNLFYLMEESFSDAVPLTIGFADPVLNRHRLTTGSTSSIFSKLND